MRFSAKKRAESDRRRTFQPEFWVWISPVNFAHLLSPILGTTIRGWKSVSRTVRDRLLRLKIFSFSRASGGSAFLTVFRRLPWTWRRSRRWFVAASHTSDADARARQSSRNLSVIRRLPSPPSSAAFPRRVWTERRLHPAPSVSALEPLPRTNMTRLVGAFVLLLALSCASPVAGQAASAQGGMYYGPFRGPLYG